MDKVKEKLNADVFPDTKYITLIDDTLVLAYNHRCLSGFVVKNSSKLSG